MPADRSSPNSSKVAALETRPFLEDSEKEILPIEIELKVLKKRCRDWRRGCMASVIANVLFIAAIVGISQVWKTHEVQLPSHDFTKDAIKMELRPFDDVFGRHYGPFLGDPRPELDDAWASLLRGYNLRVPASTPVMHATPNNTLVELTDGSGDHYATLAVLHELHCLKTIRQYLFPEYYPDTWEMFKPGPGEKIGDHMDHCIDILRQATMCHADMTILAAEWWDNEDVPQNVLYTPHKCANWESVSEWAVANSFDPWGTGLIEPPGGWSEA